MNLTSMKPVKILTWYDAAYGQRYLNFCMKLYSMYCGISLNSTLKNAIPLGHPRSWNRPKQPRIAMPG